MVEASKARNVIPAVCDVVCDCRLLPGETQEEVERAIRAHLGQDSFDFKWLEEHGGTRSELGDPFEARAEAFVAEEESAARASHPSFCPVSPTALAARGLRNGRVWLLPDARDGHRAGGTTGAFRGRADRGRRPRAWNALPPARGPYTGSASSDRIRLGGMALSNGVLVHGRVTWACAVRGTAARPKIASGEKPLLAAETESRFLRGPAQDGAALRAPSGRAPGAPEARLLFEKATWRRRCSGAR